MKGIWEASLRVLKDRRPRADAFLHARSTHKFSIDIAERNGSPLRRSLASAELFSELDLVQVIRLRTRSIRHLRGARPGLASLDGAEPAGAEQ